MLVHIQDLSVHIKNTHILEMINLTMHQGEVVTIVGPNGSGKTTLLKTIIGAIHPSYGFVEKAENIKIGYVPQHIDISASLPLTLSRFLQLSRGYSQYKIHDILEHVGLFEQRFQALTSLSGGQFQRALLARALLNDPDLLVLDEPTQGLDQPASAAFYQLIDHLRKEKNIAILMVSHDLHVVMASSDRVICLNKHICCEGKPEFVTNAPEYRALFGTGTQGALALYRHIHDHSHEEGSSCSLSEHNQE